LSKQEKAIRFIQKNDYEEAAKLFVEIIDEQPNDPIGYINFGNLLVMMKRTEEAERFFLKAIALDDHAATAFFGLGSLYYEQNLLEEAEKMLQHAIHLGIEDSEVYYLLGLTHKKQENIMLAIPFLQRATELNGETNKKFQYGLALAQADYFQEAEKVLKEVIDEEPSHADASYNLGILKLHEKKLEEAIAYMDQVLETQPDHMLATKAKQNMQKMINRS